MATRKPLVFGAAGGVQELDTSADVVPLAGQPGAFAISFPGTVTNQTIVLWDEAPFPVTLQTLRYQVGSAGGSFVVDVQNGAPGSATGVTGMTGITVNSTTRGTATGSANTSVATGNTVQIVVSSASTSPAPSGSTLTLNLKRA